MGRRVSGNDLCVGLIRLGWIRLAEASSTHQTSQMLHHKGTKDTKVSADRLSYDIVGAALEVLTYLKLLHLNLGILINFNVEVLRLGIYRIILG